MPKPAVPSAPTQVNLVLSAARYLAGKAMTVLTTIFVAVFITMVMVDVPADVGGGVKMSPFQMQLESHIDWVINVSAYNGLIPRDARGNPL